MGKPHGMVVVGTALLIELHLLRGKSSGFSGSKENCIPVAATSFWMILAT
jgi:hypothetical protein